MASKNEISFWNLFGKIIKSWDMFGVSVTLNYKEGSTFKTVLGGTVSSIVYAVFALLTVFMINRMVGKTNLNTNQNDKFVDRYQENIAPMYPLEHDFLWAFFTKINIPENIHKDLAFQFTVVSQFENNVTGKLDTSGTDIPLTPCTNLDISPKIKNKFPSEYAKYMW